MAAVRVGQLALWPALWLHHVLFHSKLNSLFGFLTAAPIVALVYGLMGFWASCSAGSWKGFMKLLERPERSG